jgi:predicted dehydrogenase
LAVLRIGIAGCGHAARIHVGRLAALEGVEVVGCADADPAEAAGLAASLGGGAGVPAFADHRELLARVAPDALAVFAPHLAHYRVAMDGLQAGCHVFIEKPLTTHIQEADDIARLARARGKVVAVGHQFRLTPALVEARRLLAEGAVGPLRLVVATMAAPWLAQHVGPEDAWRHDPKAGGTGMLADAGDHLLDALLWTTGRPASEVAAFQSRTEAGLDVVTAAAIRLGADLPATLAVSALAPGSAFELSYFGEGGVLRADASGLALEPAGGPPRGVPLPLPPPGPSIDADFVEAVRSGGEPCCPASEALETVRLLEAIGRSAASGQVVRLA